jgi:hypothetical protein
MIPLALLVASLTTYKSEKALALALALFPAGWLWMFTVSFWFTYLLPKTDWIVPILGKVGLTRGNLPDYAYTAFAMAITALFITYIVLAFIHWNRPLKSLQPEKSAKALPQAIQTASPSITDPRRSPVCTIKILLPDNKARLLYPYYFHQTRSAKEMVKSHPANQNTPPNPAAAPPPRFPCPYSPPFLKQLAILYYIKSGSIGCDRYRSE